MSFSVTEVVDGDTFKVSPNWSWNNQSGDIIRANGYNTPERGQPGYEEAKAELTKLILNKNIDLKNPIRITYGRLLCDVYLSEKNISETFSKYM